MTRQTRRGASLVEVLIVVGILALLIGLLLTAIQSVRRSASLTSSRNNLRQVGLGMQGYIAVKKATPGALITPREAEGRMSSMASYSAFTALHAQLGIDFGQEHGKLMKIFIDPSDPTVVPTGPGNALNMFACSYAANSTALRKYGRSVNDFGDGTSNTIAFACRYHRCDSSTFEYDVRGEHMPPTSRAVFAEGKFYPNQDDWGPGDSPQAHAERVGNPPRTVGLYYGPSDATFQVRPAERDCRHGLTQTPYAEGMPVALFDGSVRVLAPGIDPGVFWAATTPNWGDGPAAVE